ncbi:hypothetical protein BGZ95_002588 [Linnemannia exigua]|uniref:Crinkler effector protein N-terminal domain-containing protein n=1 Tax=Linnemannia exigua TaxID=604196 RepID=A0AAD4H394_9FUNG|nr:hypothetical protein BGZ95_002588 [Linnemannia exigua]
MDNNPLTLFCLVDGESTSNAFSIEIDSTKTVDGLKDLIKAKQSPDFDDIVAKSLTLWSVSIPDDDDDDEIPIVLGNVNNNDKKKLRATRGLLEVFPDKPPKNTIHVIVQRPPQVHVPVPARASTPLPASLSDGSRPATPIQLKSVPKDHIEKELTIVLEGVSHHHITEPVDPKDVESSQRERLGPFYKRALPYHETATDTSLVMLGLELDKQASTIDGETLHSIVEGDIGRYTDHRVVAMVAPSGSGKTATVVDLASKHFVIYCVCCIPSPTISPGFKDPRFIALAKDVERIYRTVLNNKQGALRSPQDIDSEVKELVGERVELEFLARLLFLQLLLNNKPDLEPQQFFREQTTSGASTIGELVYKLREYDNLTIQAMLDKVQTKLRSLLVSKRLGLVIALDEAQVAVTGILSEKFISPSALLKNRNDLFDSKCQIQSRFRRGFLTPLSATLSNMRATLVILGTALSLQDADHVYSAIAKPTNLSRITEFPRFDEIEVNKMLSELVDMSGCEIPPAKRRKLTGRARFSVDVVKRLATHCSSQDSKQAILVDAVDKSIEHTMCGLRIGVRTILESDKTGEAARLLSRMVLAYHLQDAKISFSSQQQSDFVDKALCRLRPHSDGVHLVMDEPMVIEAVQEELKASGKDPAFLENLDQLYQIVTNFGVASTSKGDALEPLVRRSLQRFNGHLLVDLPFLQGITLPKWCDDLKLQINGINTANGFGYTDSGVAADLAFLTERPPNKMLIAKFGTRPDGAWFFSDKRYAGSLAIKFYSSSMPQQKHDENETSSDIRACFLQKDGNLNKNLASTRRDFVASGAPSSLRGILRIHLELPDVKNGMPATHVRTDPATGVEDVMVYINLSNMDDFFFEGIAEHRGDMVNLKKVIRFVCQK